MAHSSLLLTRNTQILLLLLHLLLLHLLLLHLLLLLLLHLLLSIETRLVYLSG